MTNAVITSFIGEARRREPAPGLEPALRKALRGEVRFDAGSRALYATDASNYRQVPIGVVIPRGLDDVIATFAACCEHHAPVLARGGGTSLAGQCCNEAMVIDCSKYFNRILTLDPGRRRATVEPGCILDDLRDAAEAHHLTFGPDPSTHNRNTLGGMLGNNSCGVHSVMSGRTSDNVEALQVLTSDGLQFRVGPTSDAEVAAIAAAGGRRADIYRALKALVTRHADEIRARYPKLPRRVSGFALEQLLPENGFNVARALVGSEGTCVFITAAELQLVPSPPARVLLVLGFHGIAEAADRVPEILAANPIGLEAIGEILVANEPGQGGRCLPDDEQPALDDYLVKPFSARELLARVQAHLAAARTRREADTARRMSDERLLGALEAGRMFTYDWDLISGRYEGSDNHARLLGVSIENASAGWDLVHPDDLARARAAVDEAIARRDIYRLELRLLAPGSPEPLWFEVRGQVVCDDAGAPARVVGVAADISERKAAEHAAQEAADQLRIAIATARLGRFQLDLASGEMESSAQCKANFGLAASEPLPYARLFELIHADDRERVAATVRCAIESRTDYEAEYRTVWPGDGSVHTISARGHAVYADDGTPLRMTGVTQDVTAARRGERMLAEQVGDLTLLHELAARLTEGRELQPVLHEVLRAALALTGATKGTLALVDAARSELRLAASEGLSEAFTALVSRVAKGTVACGVAYERRARVVVEDTETDPIFTGHREAARLSGFRSVHATPLLARDGSVIGVFCLYAALPGRPDERVMRLADLLARHAAGYIEHLQLLQQVRAGERRFRGMADSAPAMLWVSDTDNALTFISRGWLEHTGQREDDAYAGGTGWSAMVHPDERDSVMQAFIADAQRREPFEVEFRLRRADGSWHWALGAGRPRFGDDGAWLGTIGSVIDVHDRVETREALREADRRKDEFLATLAHELRNPLAPIRNALHLLARPGAQAQAAGLHAMLERQVSHMVRLVDDLMEVSRISRGAIELRREPLDLADVLRTAAETCQPLIERGRHRFEMHLPGEPLPVDGDAVRLAQVMTNLLGNAARYTDDGGRIELVARRDGDDALVTVRDSGIGIEPQQLPRLFEMFAQLDRSRGQGGLGIGLSLVRRLVQMHGGSVHAASEGPGRGSKFSVRLPLAASVRSAGHDAGQPLRNTLHAHRVLVVDDNHDAADSLGLVLSMLGPQVRVEHDGAAALDAIDEWHPTVMLLDLGMPGMDGFEVARRVRADKRHRGIRLVALTGWGQDEDRQCTREAGFDHHVVKPVDPDALSALLATWIVAPGARAAAPTSAG